MSRWRCGSNAAPLQFMPPRLPGYSTLPRTLGGVKMPSERRLPILLRQSSRSCGVAPHASSTLSVCGTSGGGAMGKGCVAADASPATSLFGTARSSTPKSGVPVSRPSTNTFPVLLPWMTTGTSRPSRRSVATIGCDALS